MDAELPAGLFREPGRKTFRSIPCRSHCEGGGLAAQPADRAGQRLAKAATLTDTGMAEQHEQVEVAVGKGTNVAVQFGIGAQAEA